MIRVDILTLINVTILKHLDLFIPINVICKKRYSHSYQYLTIINPLLTRGTNPSDPWQGKVNAYSTFLWAMIDI